MGSAAPFVPTIDSDPRRRSILSWNFLATNLPSLISYLSVSIVLSAISNELNGSTTKPFLNLSKPVAGSFITRLSVFDSSNDNAVTSSTFAILVSNLPISFIV